MGDTSPGGAALADARARRDGRHDGGAIGDVSPIRNCRLSYLDVATNQERPAFLHATPSPCAESPAKKALGGAGDDRANTTALSALTRPAPASSYILKIFF